MLLLLLSLHLCIIINNIKKIFYLVYNPHNFYFYMYIYNYNLLSVIKNEFLKMNINPNTYLKFKLCIIKIKYENIMYIKHFK